MVGGSEMHMGMWRVISENGNLWHQREWQQLVDGWCASLCPIPRGAWEERAWHRLRRVGARSKVGALREHAQTLVLGPSNSRAGLAMVADARRLLLVCSRANWYNEAVRRACTSEASTARGLHKYGLG